MRINFKKLENKQIRLYFFRVENNTKKIPKLSLIQFKIIKGHKYDIVK